MESETGSNINQAIDVLTSAAEAATTKTIDAFQILMAGGRTKVDQQPTEYMYIMIQKENVTLQCTYSLGIHCP